MFIIRNQSSRKSGAVRSCRQCMRIRLFLMVAMMLIVSFLLVDKNEAPLSGITTLDFALIVVGVGLAGFALRIIQYWTGRTR